MVSVQEPLEFLGGQGPDRQAAALVDRPAQLLQVLLILLVRLVVVVVVVVVVLAYAPLPSASYRP
jgi:hypothetical protein